MIPGVGVNESINAHERWADAPPQTEFVMATGAAEGCLAAAHVKPQITAYDARAAAYDDSSLHAQGSNAFVPRRGPPDPQGSVGAGAPATSSWFGVAAKTACFTADTPVLLADGTSKPIEDIAVGDKVTAYDPDTGRSEVREVVRTYVHHDVPTYDVTLTTGEKVTTTQEHPFWVEGKGWTPATQLMTGDQLRQPDGSTAQVASVHATGKTATVYNFEVQGQHDYYVKAGNTWILVHNTCTVTSLISNDARLVKEAERAGKSVQSGIDSLTTQLQAGNLNPGIGSKKLFGEVSYARTRDGARVFFRASEGKIEILGKASKENEPRVIALLQELYGG